LLKWLMGLSPVLLLLRVVTTTSTQGDPVDEPNNDRSCDNYRASGLVRWPSCDGRLSISVNDSLSEKADDEKTTRSYTVGKIRSGRSHLVMGVEPVLHIPAQDRQGGISCL
jgi:hypothetical protein